VQYIAAALPATPSWSIFRNHVDRCRRQHDRTLQAAPAGTAGACCPSPRTPNARRGRTNRARSVRWPSLRSHRRHTSVSTAASCPFDVAVGAVQRPSTQECSRYTASPTPRAPTPEVPPPSRLPGTLLLLRPPIESARLSLPGNVQATRPAHYLTAFPHPRRSLLLSHLHTPIARVHV